MISLIFVAMLLPILLLFIAFLFRQYVIGAISSILMVVVAVYILINGIENITNILTLGIGVVYFGLGFYIFIGGTLEQIEGG